MRWSLLGLLLAFPLVAGEMPKLRDPGEMIALYGGEGSLAILRQPSAVKVCRLREVAKAAKGGEDVVTLNRISYERGPWKTLSADHAQQIQAQLLKVSNYDWKSISFCDPNYNYRVCFQANGDHLTIDYCLSCQELLVSKNGAKVGDKLFESPVFLKVLRDLFPEDQAPQGVTK